MIFYHLDENSGAVTACRNPQSCKREWHYRTAADAQAAYEEGMREQLIPAPVSKEVQG